MKESMVLLVLGGCWAGYLAWYWRENRRTTSRRSDGMRSFSSGLGSLGGAPSRAIPFNPSVPALAPRTATDAAQRRRHVLVGLGAAAVVTLIAALAVGGIAVLAHVVIDLVLASYAYAIVQRRNDAAEREIKVHMLYPDRTPHEVAPARQVVNS